MYANCTSCMLTVFLIIEWHLNDTIADDLLKYSLKLFLMHDGLLGQTFKELYVAHLNDFLVDLKKNVCSQYTICIQANYTKKAFISNQVDLQ